MTTEYLKEYTRNKNTLKCINQSSIHVSEDILKRASSLLILLRVSNIKQPEFIAPHADGGAIQMEYENKKWYLEITVSKSTYEIMLVSNDDYDDIPLVDLDLDTKNIFEVVKCIKKYTLYFK